MGGLRLRTIKSKIIAVFIGFTCMVVMLQFGIFQQWIGTMILDNSESYFQETVHQIGKRMELQLKQFRTMAEGIGRNQVVINYLADLKFQQINYQIAKYKINYEVLRVTKLDWVDNMVIYPVYDPPINLYYTVPVFDPEPSIENMLQSNYNPPQKSLLWMRLHNSTNQISAIIPIDENGRLGVLSIGLKPAIFSEILDEAKIGKHGTVYVVKDGVIVYAQDPALIGVSVSKLQQDRDTQVEYTMDEAGWTLIGRVPQSELWNQITKFNRIFVLMVIVLLAAIMCFAIVAMRLVLRPLKIIIKGMERVQQGDLTVVLAHKNEDEFGRILDHFNYMVERIQGLIQTIYKQQRHQRKAEILSLLAKLNPHFLYNSLDMIYWKAIMKGEDEIGNTIVALSNILRYSISQKDEFVPVAEDMKQLESYLQIQKLRFEDKLHYHFDIPPAMKNCQIPKLLIQPLVENAIKYAFRDMKDEGCMTICGQLEDGDLVFHVIDNGIGMSSEKVEKLIASCEMQSEETGIGIRLVHQRIVYLYGEGYGISINSEIGRGTTVSLRLGERKLLI
ncbi:cache domain-containing sensor histidine kinase [Paenibacillus aestuarii]|nr:sensor histidine kinase [Paenibacillus aestuarii]